MKEQLFLSPVFAELWRGLDPFAEVRKLSGTVFRQVKNRRTVKFSAGGANWFLKYHGGVGWREIVKNILNFKRPVLGAMNEFAAIRKLEEIGVETMRCGAFGVRGGSPARLNSFIVTAEIENAASLEEVARRGVAPEWKRRIIRRLGEISKTLHLNGVNHCDYYLCHFLMTGTCEDFKLHLIDLHRARIRKKVPAHYLFKDMGGLWFSAMDANLSRADCLRFVRAYSGNRPLREELTANRAFWRRVNRVGEKLYLKEFGRAPKLPFDHRGSRR